MQTERKAVTLESSTIIDDDIEIIKRNRSQNVVPSFFYYNLR